MADAAEYGLMLWDGNSKGTINNVVNLTHGGKPVVVYVAPKRRFLTVRTLDDLGAVLAQGQTESVEQIVSREGLAAQPGEVAFDNDPPNHR